MPSDLDHWTARTRAALERYALPLRHAVVGAVVRPRTAIPADELADKYLSTLLNPPVLDRRLKELPDAGRVLLALVGQSRQPLWSVGQLLTLLAAAGHADGVKPVLDLLAAGMLLPDLPDGDDEIGGFDAWLAASGGLPARVFVHPTVAGRSASLPTGLPPMPGEPNAALTPRVADGLDWPLRLAVAWQRVDAGPLRLTQGNTLFRRDQTRLQADELLTAPAPDQLLPVADPGLLALFWAHAAGLLTLAGGELRAGSFPAGWGPSFTDTLADLWAALPLVEGWDPLVGYALSDTGLSPAPTAGLLAVLLLAQTPPGEWVRCAPVAEWLWEHHPSWSGALPPDHQKTGGRGWVEAFLLGVAYPLRLVEAANADGWVVRLTDLGRHLFAGGPAPVTQPPFPQTLMVQPNAEILAYRQGLTPALIGRLSRFAGWKALGPACTLELTAENTYRGLEGGLTLAGVVQTLNQHGVRPVPPAVADLLGRWANKRERISVYPAATLVEFQTPADLEMALARGVVSVRVTDRIGLTDDGREPDFQNLRLTGNRDYEAKPQRCLSVGPDGVTLTVDPVHADLVLEAEIGKVADPLAGSPPGVRRFLLTPESVRRGVAAFGLSELDTWFLTRTGEPLTPAGRLFAVGGAVPPPTVGRLLVVRVPSAAIADGLTQWPATAALLGERLGPTAVVVTEDRLEELRAVLAGIGVTLGDPGPDL